MSGERERDRGQPVRDSDNGFKIHVIRMLWSAKSVGRSHPVGLP